MIVFLADNHGILNEVARPDVPVLEHLLQEGTTGPRNAETVCFDAFITLRVLLMVDWL